MASITSVISFLILLLATYSYSAPVKQEYVKSTPTYEFTTGTTIVEHEDSFKMRLISDDESTDVPHIHKDRSAEESNSGEVTTSGDVTLSPRSLEDSPTSSSEESNENENEKKRGLDELNEKKRGLDESNEKKRDQDELNEKKRGLDESNEKKRESNEKRSFDEFSFTTLESSTEFDRRAIRPNESQEEIEVTTHFEPSSSVDSFGKITGLLHHDETEEIFTTPEYQKHDRSSEESTTRLPVKTQHLTKTVSIFPGKITETKIYLNVPTEKPVVTVNVEEKELKKIE